MAEAFYPFVAQGSSDEAGAAAGIQPQYPARVAVYDDPLSTPRVVEIEPCEPRAYLEQITETTNRLAHEQGSAIPFMVIREIVENLIHAYFAQPTVSVLDGGNTITFSDQGPGIANKDLARQYGTTSATPEMRRYIRGVGSGLPYVEAWLAEHGGELVIADNIAGGTMVTVTLAPGATTEAVPAEYPVAQPATAAPVVPPASQAPQYPGAMPTGQPAAPGTFGYAQAPYGYPAYAPYPQGAPQQPYGWPAPGYTMPYQAVPAPVGQNGAFGQAAAPVGGMPVGQQNDVFIQHSAPGPLDAREEQVVAFLTTHAEVGPTDLVRAYGGSAPTWSRVLATLEQKGLLRKAGQKRTLTDIGRAYLG